MQGAQNHILAEVNLSNSKIQFNQIDVAENLEGLQSYELVLDKYKDMFVKAISEPSKNPIISISTGPLTGTGAPGSATYFINFVSPVNGKIISRICEGPIGPYLRYAGIDHLVLYGKAKKPVTLSINNEGINIISAKEIQDLDAVETIETLHRQLGEDNIIASSGAIKKAARSRFASVVYDYHYEVEAIGLGRVFFDLGIKALAINGQGGVALAQPEEFLQELIDIYKYYRSTNASKTQNDQITKNTYLSPWRKNDFIKLSGQYYGLATDSENVLGLKNDDLLKINQQCLKEGISQRMVLEFIKENAEEKNGDFTFDMESILKDMEKWTPDNQDNLDISTIQATGLYWDDKALPFIGAIDRAAKLLKYYSGKEWNSFHLEEAGRQIASISNELYLGVK
ncbi:MAG TPA: aldehyde ferredoxin oxidoreductase N-terminal domain-containing protein [Syntrophomonadaceae bacterium]|nr:aldehyde ferredoxin oxidoreductase N-terminal domain-containing protein [Syntrophomonadaceae bacterium]